MIILACDRCRKQAPQPKPEPNVGMWKLPDGWRHFENPWTRGITARGDYIEPMMLCGDCCEGLKSWLQRGERR